MKTTSYEISKQLKEIGFKADCSYLWFEKDQAFMVNEWINPVNQIERHNKEKITYLPDNNRSYSAYDLETILDALPAVFNFEINRDKTCPDPNSVDIIYLKLPNHEIFRVIKKDNESLADTAARLLIKLHQEGLIKFDK